MAQYLFGSGIIWGTPGKDANGNTIANPTPVKFGVLQDCAIDISFDTKLLYGPNQFPVAVGRGKGKISGKAKFAQINGMLLNSLFFGQTLASGVLGMVNDTVGALIPATPFTITPTPPDTGVFAYDLGVSDANGNPMTRVVSAPATGQYSITAGAYLFATADTGLRVFINYAYTSVSTTGKKSTVINLPMGYAPSFAVDLLLPYEGKMMTLSLPKAIGSKMSLATKQDDFVIPEFDFEAFANSAGTVMSWHTTE